MRLLLDTQAFRRWLAGSRRLSANARSAVENDANDVLVSVATAWEIATKHRRGNCPRPDWWRETCQVPSVAGQGFKALAITVDDAQRAGQRAGPHRGPFDRVLIAQEAVAHGLALVSIDAVFDGYGVNHLW